MKLFIQIYLGFVELQQLLNLINNKQMQQLQRGEEERNADLHLLLSEKYMAYKDLADRCLLNRDEVGKGDKRVFYMKPKSPFLEDPRAQNQYRNEFVRAVGQAPPPEPLTFLADDLHKAFIEKTMDKSNPDAVRRELCQFFKRRQYKLQHARYKLLLRWAHYCQTSETVDKAALKFNPACSKIQFELENAVKRYTRLEGDDHFLTPDRPQQKAGSSYADDGVRPPLSALRADDIDVYLRLVTYEDKIMRKADRFIQRAKWVPMAHRFHAYQNSIKYFQDTRSRSMAAQDKFITVIKEKGEALIDMKKLGDDGMRELQQIVEAQHLRKLQKQIKNPRDALMSTAKYNYELPPMIYWNEVELKVGLASLANKFNVQGDMEVENGHTFSYSVMVFFPQHFQHQVIQNQFAPYDAIPSLIDPANLAKKNIKKVLRRNQKKYGRTQGANTLLEVLEIQKHSKEMGVEFLNSVDRALFGEFNHAQMPDFPTVRVKRSDWIELICCRPELDNDQMYQASILSGDKNWIDECLANFLEILNVQDVQNVNLIMESIAQIHYDKVKYGSVKTDFLNFDPNDVDTFFTEDQKQFLSLFKSCFKSKAEYDSHKSSVELPASSIQEIPQHLLFANYLLRCLDAREQKTKLLYTLNTFRSIQRRITLELREMGTRDRVLGDAHLVKPMEQGVGKAQSDDDDDATSIEDAVGDGGGEGSENIDITKDPLIDINKYRFNKKMSNYLNSTCPLVPKFHATYGQPIERQEISQELDNARNTDAQKQEAKKLLGRVEKIYKHKSTDLNLVQDDFGVHILYDAAFSDMRSMEIEILKVCSFYINKAEPLLDNDLRNMYPAVDRLKILDEALYYENLYQEEKLLLVTAYLECYEHITDVLEQQRLIQAIVDEMALRPKLNLSGAHFKDSYLAEIECIKAKTELVRELMKMLVNDEFKENNAIRTYLEKSYRLLHEQIQNRWNYTDPEKLEEELNVRELTQTGAGGLRDAKNDMLADTESGETRKRNIDEIEISQRVGKTIEKASKIESANYADAKDFAERLGIPYSNLEVLLKDHHERDPLVRQSLHENVAFIKTSEGFPRFIYQNAIKENCVRFTPQSKSIGLLDFYESLQVMPRCLSSIKGAVQGLMESHKPDNGLLSTALEKCTYDLLLAELKTVQNEDSLYLEKSRGMDLLDDDSVVGNSDKMLFFTKELSVMGLDQAKAQNPFVVGKLDIDSVEAFDFNPFQGYIGAPESGYSEEKNGKEEKVKVTKRNFNRFYPVVRERTRNGLNFPTMLVLSCNAVEIVRLRHTLLMTLEQAIVLEEVFLRQTKLMGKESSVYFKEQFNFVNYVNNGGENFVNFIDEGPTDDIDIKLAINEFDKKLRSCLNFTDPECFKALVLPLGLEELRAIVQYEVMNLQALVVGVRTNQILLDNSERKVCEIEFVEKGYAVANPVFNLYDKLQGANALEPQLKKVISQEKSSAQSAIKSQIGEGYYNIITRKHKMKETCEKVFKHVKASTTALKDQKIEVTQKQLRGLKLVLCHDYCQDMLARVYCDAMRLQILYETDRLRRRQYLLPRESIFLELFKPIRGEHQFAAYNEDHQAILPKEQTLFFNKADGKIQNYWRLPSNHEVLGIDVDIDAFKALNMPNNFRYDLGVPAEKTLPEFICKDQLERVQARVQKLTLVDTKDLDSLMKEKARLVEFAQAFDYGTSGKAQHYLSYFKSISNIFDLEFFTNKLASSSNTIANVEKMVLSGVAFWEEGDEALFADMDEGSESEEDEASPKGPAGAQKGKKAADENKFEDGGHRPLKNVLAGKVADKIAQEKRAKMQLRQDLESIKDKFAEYEVTMKKQEMAGSLQRAAAFLNDIHHITFYGVVFILYQLQDNYFKDQKGQKEIQFINEVIQGLSHQQDLKVTYLNGFHVNYAITSLDRTNLESSAIDPDYDSFFKATQPVIDEEALSPPEFNLIQGVYLTNSINLTTFKKNLSYMGALLPRDYSCLDYALTNVSKDTRKYIMSNLNSNDLTLQSYISAKMNMNEKEYQSNPSIYSQILQEKKGYLKIQIKARQSKRIMMIIRSKQMIPLDISQYNELLKDYHSALHWKINNQMDQIANNRAAASEREMANLRKKNPAQMINSSMKHNKESVLKLHDAAASEIEVIHTELQKYMIKTAFEMFQSETNALTRTFEINNIKIHAFVHPAQQFASTFHQNVDGRNHLDIISKVGPIQKMLTQIKNRCLEIQTLTSGVGVVISSKDLNECLEECCRSLIKYGEIEMRTRCEHLSMTLVQYENLLYVKDRQLLNLENKLRTAKQEMNKIVNTKVFSRGNNLIYELDMTTRQLRLLKDNIFLLEKNLTEKIKLCYDRELDQTRMQLAEFRGAFNDYKEGISQEISARVRVKVNGIDAEMKAEAARYQDTETKTRRQMALEEYQSKQINVNNTTLNIDNIIINNDGSVAQGGGPADPKLLEELEELKKHEEEARTEVLRLQNIIRKYRIMSKFKEVLTRERHQYKIDNLKQQLTSNTTLWEQLAEGEKREKILKQEIERAQQEIATQEKIIERLKDDIKQEGREKQKLLQYKNTKSKRLDELETKAREFEVLSSVNLGKILALLESKERKITSMSSAEGNMNEFIGAMTALNQQEMAKVRQKAKDETKYKMEAMTKLEGLRQELQMIQGNDQVSVGFWKEQCQSLFDICKNLKEDNEKLVENLGSLSENAMMGMPQQNMSMNGGAHPLDQFTNNQDLLNYLNTTPRMNVGYDQMGGSLQSAHRRGQSQQSVNLAQFSTQTQARDDYEKQMFGMNKSLQEHMLGGNRRGAGSQNPARQTGPVGSSMNSFGSERQDYMPQGSGPRFALPKINVGGARNQHSNFDSAVMAGGRRAGAGAQQQSPFGDPGQGKMTPMYEKQQQRFGGQPRGKAGNIFGPGGGQGGANVFSSLQGGQLDSPHKFVDGSSIDQTTMVQSSVQQQNSPGQMQMSVDQPGAGPTGQSMFNFAAAPQSQRTPLNVDARQDSLNQGFVSNRDVIPEMSDQTLNHYGELEPNALNTIDGASGKKRGSKAKGQDGAIKLSLQPKLINPPSKLTKTIDHQSIRGAHAPKRQPPM